MIARADYSGQIGDCSRRNKMVGKVETQDGKMFDF